MLQCNFLYNKRLPNIITVLYSGQPEGHTGGLRDTGSYKGKWRKKIGVLNTVLLNMFSKINSERHKNGTNVRDIRATFK